MVKVLKTDPPWLRRAFADLGLKEVPGKGSNPRIVEMYALAKNSGVKEDSVPWCSAAVNAWMAESGIEGTRSLLARSWLAWGTKPALKPLPRGAVLIFKRGNSSWQGHVCLLLEDNGSVLTVIGGNQSDAVTIARYRRTSLIGARWPVTPIKPATKPIPEPAPEMEALPAPDVEEVPPEGVPPHMPPDVEPLEAPVEHGAWGWMKRRWRGASGVGGFSIFAFLTDPWVWAVLIGGAIVVALIALVIALFLFGRQRVASWVRGKIG
jgi:uncharacterized protein (TIGR02594 family)